MVVQQKDIEQLWYTWSNVGLDTIREGFRIRAASEGLQDLRDLRVRNLAPYQHYFLPQDANPSLSLSIAPLCLSFVITAEDRLLISKTYTGKDAVGRYGVFFMHLLLNLPDDFSAKDAILLWKSPFLQHSDASLPDRRSTSLERVSVDYLKQWRGELALAQQSRTLLSRYLPYVIQVYLTKTAGQQIYLAGADELVAQLILGLTHCLPLQLVKNLTFSTYEQNVAEATTEIVGTCWLSTPEAAHDPHVQYLLPAHFYEEKLALNCYIDRYSPLDQHPLVLPHPLAAAFAQDAAEHFLFGGREDFQDLLETAEEYSTLDSALLLELYKTHVVNAKQPTQPDVESALRPRSPAGYRSSAKLLARSGYRNALIRLSLELPGWWQTVAQPAVINLRNVSAQMPAFAPILSALARDATPVLVELVKHGMHASGSREVLTHEDARCMILLELLNSAAPPGFDIGVWLSLLEELLTLPKLFLFFDKYWNISALFVTLIETVFRQLVLDAQWWSVTEHLFQRLVASGYQYKMAVLFILLASEPGSQEKNVLSLLRMAALTLPEQLVLLRDAGKQFLAASPKLSSVMLEMFSHLVKNNPPHEKLQVLFTWLDLPPLEERLLAKLLELARLNPAEAGLFFQRYAEQYIPLYPQLPILLKLFMSAELGKDLRFSLVMVWLTQPLDPQTLDQILRSSTLSLNQIALLLDAFGEKYLSQYTQLPVLLEYRKLYLENIQILDTAPFKQISPATKLSLREGFLGFLLRSTAVSAYAQQLLYDWLVVGNFLRIPSFVHRDTQQLSESLGRLLGDAVMPIGGETCQQILVELGNAHLELIYLDDESAFVLVASILYPLLSALDLAQMFSTIAKVLKDRVYQKQAPLTVFSPYIRFALCLQARVTTLAEAESLAYAILDLLLQDSERKSFQQLDAAAKKWPRDLSSAWQRYKSQRPFLLLDTNSSLLERVKLRWEERVAFLRLSWAMNRHDTERIALISLETMTTLSNYRRELPDGWWENIEIAQDFFSTRKEIELAASLSRLRQISVPPVPSSINSPTLSSGEQLSWFGRMRLWRIRKNAFFQMSQALSSGKIGSIVSVATNYMPILEKYREKVPATWWRQIDVAFDFFQAFEDALEGRNVAKEQALLFAAEQIEQLSAAGYPAPGFSAHENKRLVIAQRYMISRKNEHSPIF